MTQTSRRTFIATGTAVAAGAVVSTLPALPAAAATSTYFRHGLASGDPLPDAVVIWTRVTPTAASQPGSGKGPRATVTWEVATDRTFRRVVRTGTVTTSAARDHTVKVDVTRLKPATTYYYRFTHRKSHSPVARTRTAPAYGAAPRRMRLGVVSCANLQAGWFSSYRHLAARTDLDAVLHMGDYIYEYGNGEYGYGNKNVDIRPHVPAHEVLTLADYRQRHAQYKQDPDLAALHQKVPFILLWDDHETANDTYTDGAENHTPETEGDFAERRRVSLQAYDEWQPVRLGGTAAIEDARTIYRKFRFGDLIELSLLDLRSYRNAPGKEFSIEIGVTGDPRRVIAGDEQLGWLKDNLSTSTARWNLVGNPVMITPVLIPPLPNLVTDALAGFAGILPTEGILQHRPVGRLRRRAQEAHRPHRGPQDPERRVPDRGHPLGLGVRRPGRQGSLPAGRIRRDRAGHLVGHEQQPRRHPRCPVTVGLDRRGDRVPGAQPLHQVRQPRRPRLLGPRRDAGADPDGLVRHQRPGRPRCDVQPDPVVRGRGRDAGREAGQHRHRLSSRVAPDVTKPGGVTFPCDLTGLPRASA